MEWATLAYTRSCGHHGQQLIRDVRSRPTKVSWSQHALWRAWERAQMNLHDAVAWFACTEYLGRWARSEAWGNDQYVALGIRDKARRSRMNITTLIPRAYWDYDITQYDTKMSQLGGYRLTRSETDG